MTGAARQRDEQERKMIQAEHEQDSGTWLRRAWNVVARALEAMERSPFDLLLERIYRLECEVAELKQKGAAGIGRQES